jgi:putative ABC transport system ATP-binding protein
MSSSIIAARDLTKVYHKGVASEALRGVSLEVAEGSWTCIVGPSGHGKSTLLRILGGLEKPTSGRVLFAGQDMSQMSDDELAETRLRKIGFVFQFFNLVPNLTALENVQLPLMFAKMPVDRQEVRANELLAFMGLEGKSHARPGQLSGGQQQRVAIARALANDPDVLLMDEPTGNLDSDAASEVLAHIDRARGEGKTILLVTHHEGIAQRAQRVVRLLDGRVA